MGLHPQGARRVAIGAAIAAVVTSVLVGVGGGIGTAQEPPPAAESAPAESAPVRLPAAAPTPEADAPEADAPASETESAAPTTVESAAPESAQESAAQESSAPDAEEAPETRSPSPASIPARTAAAPTLVAGTPCTTAAKACVDLNDRTAWLIEDGVVRRGPVSIMIGDEIDPTPLGTFTVEWKAKEWTSREYLTPMPYSVFFAEGGIAFHEGNQQTNSAGCVKLIRQDAIAWFNYLQVGDEVQIH